MSLYTLSSILVDLELSKALIPTSMYTEIHSSIPLVKTLTVNHQYCHKMGSHRY